MCDPPLHRRSLGGQEGNPSPVPGSLAGRLLCFVVACDRSFARPCLPASLGGLKGEPGSLQLQLVRRCDAQGCGGMGGRPEGRAEWGISVAGATLGLPLLRQGAIQSGVVAALGVMNGKEKRHGIGPGGNPWEKRPEGGPHAIGHDGYGFLPGFTRRGGRGHVEKREKRTAHHYRSTLCRVLVEPRAALRES